MRMKWGKMWHWPFMRC